MIPRYRSPTPAVSVPDVEASLSPAEDVEEMEIAARLLEITSEPEVDEFLREVLEKALRPAGAGIAAPALAPLAQALKRVLHAALPVVGGAGTAALHSSAGQAAARTTRAADAFGLELEGISQEDQEFEIARRFVRFTRAAARRFPRFARRAPPRVAARRALITAARRHAPGLLRRRRPRRPRVIYRRPLVAASPVFVYPEPEPLVAPTPAPDPEPEPEPPPAPEPDAATDAEPDVDGGNGDNGEPAPSPEPAASAEEPGAAPAGCRCGGRCRAGRRARGQWTRSGSRIVLSDSPSVPSTPIPQQRKGTIMHDLDRTTLEIGQPNESEFPEEFEFTQQESPFNETEEEELAAQLLEVTDEAELDQFIGGLIKKVSRAARRVIKSPVGQQLGGYLKGAIKKALPIAGSAIGGAIAPGGGAVGARLASKAGQMLGLELENMGEEEQEFEVARQLVRLAGTAVQNAAEQDETATADPRAAAKAAVVAAAKSHAPGLLRATPPTTAPTSGRRASGRWYRQGNKIVVLGA